VTGTGATCGREGKKKSEFKVKKKKKTERMVNWLKK